jgi:hypothetical protein
MTTWEFARLGAGQYGLPGPALVVSQWVLDVRLASCPTPGFRRVVDERSWAKLRTLQSVYADFSDPGYVWVYRTDNPDHESLHRDYSGGDDWDRMSAVDWWVASGFAKPCSPEFFDSVHTRASVILTTGDLAVRWAAEQDGRAAGFRELFPPGSYAAVVPLLVHVYPAGVGTRPPTASGWNG